MRSLRLTLCVLALCLLIGACDSVSISVQTGVTVVAPTAVIPTVANQVSSLYPPVPASLKQVDVVRVVDGDTVDVNLDGVTTRVRLIGINTPETVDPNKPVECYGPEASKRAKALLEGQRVLLEADPSQDDRDRYDRLLRYIWFEDGRLFNMQMVLEGYAYEYTYQVPYKYQAVFKAAQRQAEEAQRGLWSPATCNGQK
jgi:micrococcal nuclease